MPRLSVGDIFRDNGQEYRQKYRPALEQRRVMRDIEACRTAALGGHLDRCDRCGHERPSYNSCRNRHCPNCQSLNQARWIKKRKERVLVCKHFHVVFTLPFALRGLAQLNREVVFSILFQVAAATLKAFGSDPKWLGGQLGITAVLHTWTRELGFHVHLHCIVTDGGLSDDGKRWVHAKGNGRFLFPVEAVGEVFRAKFVAALRKARKKGKLRFEGGCAKLARDKAFARFCNELFERNWVVYAKRPFGTAQDVFDYLGRYTHRVGISNQRLVSIDDDGIEFATKDGKTTRLRPLELIRRFLMHVLPKGFTKIRHYGLMASANVNTKLEAARRLLSCEQPEDSAGDPTTEPQSWSDLLEELTGVDPLLCPRCGVGRMVRHRLPEPRPP